MRFHAYVALSALLTAFSTSASRADMPCESGSGLEGRWVRHASGFEITRLNDLDVTCTESGVAVTDPTLPERTSSPATVRLLSAAPDFDSPATRRLPNGDWADYRVDENDGGSGGAEYRLNAWRMLPSGIFLLVEQTMQIEPGFGLSEPAESFALCWSLLARGREAD